MSRRPRRSPGPSARGCVPPLRSKGKNYPTARCVSRRDGHRRDVDGALDKGRRFLARRRRRLLRGALEGVDVHLEFRMLKEAPHAPRGYVWLMMPSLARSRPRSSSAADPVVGNIANSRASPCPIRRMTDFSRRVAGCCDTLGGQTREMRRTLPMLGRFVWALREDFLGRLPPVINHARRLPLRLPWRRPLPLPRPVARIDGKFLRGHEYRPSAVLLISAHWQTTVPT